MTHSPFFMNGSKLCFLNFICPYVLYRYLVGTLCDDENIPPVSQGVGRYLIRWIIDLHEGLSYMHVDSSTR